MVTYQDIEDNASGRHFHQVSHKRRWDNVTDDGSIISVNWDVVHGLVVDGQQARRRAK